MKLKEIQILINVLEKNRVLTLNTFGNSMYPAIKMNDKIVIKQIDKNISEKDIVVFFDKIDEDYFVVAHRVEKIIDNEILLTKGDNNKRYDPIVKKSNVLGKVIEIIREEEP